jgi:arylsulfatase
LVALDDQPWELYDFAKDRIEMNDLSEKKPERVKAMSAAWDRWGAENQVTPLPKDLRVKYLKPD